MKRYAVLFSVFGFLLFSACDEDITDFNPVGDARYSITFTGMWTEASHGPVPGNAHFTTIIGLTHETAAQWFAPGSPATAGIEEVAETGKIDKADDEINGIIDAGNAFSKLVMEVPFGPTVTGNGEFTAVEEKPYFSAASMIAPSPDWFIGIRDFLLYDGAEWVSDTTFSVGMYDAGTEDGDVFSLDNPDTTPRGNVEILTAAGATVLANGQTTLSSIGTVRIQRIE